MYLVFLALRQNWRKINNYQIVLLVNEPLQVSEVAALIRGKKGS